MKDNQKKAIAKRLKEIELANNGILTPDAVVQEAKDPDSVLHELFEWDDGVAGHKYRIEQARTIISSVKVIIRTETTSVNAVYYVRDPEAKHKEQGYVSLTTLSGDLHLARESVINEFSRVSACLQRAKIHADALGLGGEVEGMLYLVDGVFKKIRLEKQEQ
jgi:hypothetical protein